MTPRPRTRPRFVYVLLLIDLLAGCDTFLRGHVRQRVKLAPVVLLGLAIIYSIAGKH